MTRMTSILIASVTLGAMVVASVSLADQQTKTATPWKAMPIRQQSPKEAYLAVLEHAGCSLPKRDSIDARIIGEVRNGTASHGNNGIIDKPGDVGGWRKLESGTAPADDKELALSLAALKYARHARGGRIMDPSEDLSSYLDRKPHLLPPEEVIAGLRAAQNVTAYL